MKKAEKLPDFRYSHEGGDLLLADAFRAVEGPGSKKELRVLRQLMLDFPDDDTARRWRLPT